MLDISLLGTGGMVPMPNRYLTSMLCRYNGRMLLVDCGEGTQISMKVLGWGYKNIDCICFTHFHADHIAGLPGLLLAISNSERIEPLTIVGPPGLEHVVRSLLVIAPEINFEINIMELPVREHSEIPVPLTEFYLSILPLDHGKPCFGYRISTKRGARFDLERAKSLNLPVKLWGRLQRSETVEYEGKAYTPDMVLGAERKGFTLSYVTDTRPIRRISDFVKNSDLFICEGLYGDPEKTEQAREHKHMTYADAATLARDGNVGALWLTHFSPAMINTKEFLPLARGIFPSTWAAYDRITKTFKFEED
ncbi:MAG: ribonuclease Z [Defluviitaleaceae bacterium]|nr:ribonuclease Z [Defluviitaleaceae bacterium]